MASAPTGPLPDLRLEGFSKIYSNGVHAVRDLDLEVGLGEFLVLVGPSGCGKTTALRTIAGLEEPTSGRIWIGDRVVNSVSPRDRDIAMVFQNYALYPHMTVRQNIAYGLRVRRMPKVEIDERVTRAARTLDLEAVLDRRPKELSGGQRQRIAMGRAIVREPRVFLMDEPLSNLDARLRVQMRAEIAELQKDLGVTTVYVTHDQIEAMTMGDRVAVMRDGELQQVAAPQELYERPDNLFVAAFIGSPSMNLAVVTLKARSRGGLTADLGASEIRLPDRVVHDRPALLGYEGQEVVVGVRPEDLQPTDDAVDAARIRARVALTEALGSELLVHFELPLREPTVTRSLTSSESASTPGSTRWIASFRARAAVDAGDEIDVAVDTDRFHFFDLESGRAIWSA